MYKESSFVDSAKKYLKMSLNHAFENNDSSSIANSYLLYSSIYHFENKLDSNLILIKNALEINLKIKDNNGIINCYDMLGSFYFENAKQSKNRNDIVSNSKKSIYNLKKTSSLLRGKRKDTIVFYEIYKLLAENYENLGQIDSSLKYFKEYLARFESVKKTTNKRIYK